MSSQCVEIQSGGKYQRVPSIWTAAHVGGIDAAQLPEIAIISAKDAHPLNPQLALWDIWPVQLADGTVAEVAGGSLWNILCAPRGGDPDHRHDVARLRLLFRHGELWTDCGNLLPDGFSPGSREWSGSTRLNDATGDVTLWFTATGQRGDGASDFEQRLFHAVGTLDLTGPFPAIGDWRELAETVRNDGQYYANLATHQGVAGRIKGFRDPYWFRDPAEGKSYILFTGSQSAAVSQSEYDGVIGIAEAKGDDGDYALLPPIIDAAGVVNELERPHIFVHAGLYYLFWSSHSGVFAPNVAAGPTGLYGMVGPSLFGPFEPLNGSGLVLANPASEPRQCYAWQVLPSLDVVSFIDYWGVEGRDIEADAALKVAHFGGTLAPMIKISLSGATSRIVAGGA